MEVAGLSKTTLNIYQIDITSRKTRVAISIYYYPSSLFPLNVQIIKRFSTSHNLFVFLKVFRDVHVRSVYNMAVNLLVISAHCVLYVAHTRYFLSIFRAK